jgi:hypothetical protein
MIVNNESKFTIEYIEIDELGENVKVKLTSKDEQKLLSSSMCSSGGRIHYGVQTLWLSSERKRELGLHPEWPDKDDVNGEPM